MHIPSVTTDKIQLVTFQQALEAANRPSPDYDIEKWLYAPPFYSEYRYILGTRGKNPLICIGINPSTAEPDNLDNTLKSVERIALGNGFDSFIMFNVYAQRATSPDDMEKTWNLQLHKQLPLFRNLFHIRLCRHATFQLRQCKLHLSIPSFLRCQQLITIERKIPGNFTKIG